MGALIARGSQLGVELELEACNRPHIYKNREPGPEEAAGRANVPGAALEVRPGNALTDHPGSRRPDTLDPSRVSTAASRVSVSSSPAPRAVSDAQSPATLLDAAPA